MDVKELRVGNKVQILIALLGWQETEVDGQLIMALEANPNIDCKPIPLTEKGLEDLGLDMTQLNIFEIEIGRKWFSIMLGECNSIVYRPNIGLPAEVLNAEIEYLHQLQNVIFSLASEELTTK